MNYCDTNIILRYLLADNDALFAQALAILEEKTVFVPNELVVIAFLLSHNLLPFTLLRHILTCLCVRRSVASPKCLMQDG
ncbi:hypothetical protein SAMN03092900_0160 [Thiomicrospira sp. ALE5]|nr:hypothetical protein SAMN03092900_0160 [Thiomicrospira sp. ALE5]